MLALGLLVSIPFHADAADAPPPASRITIDWTNPSDFTEARQNPGYGIGRQQPGEWLPELAKRLRYVADARLPAGEHLAVTLTDVKRAGIFEPWRGPQWNDVRIIKDFYPPRIDLRFTVTDAHGAALRSGERSLRDPAFLDRAVPMQSDPLRYEKRLLDDWVRREFKTPTDPRGAGAAADSE